MDLLDSIGEESGDQAQAHRLGLLEPQGRETPAMLLAGVPAPMSGSAEARFSRNSLRGPAGQLDYSAPL
jgi:hypothetical protein